MARNLNGGRVNFGGGEREGKGDGKGTKREWRPGDMLRMNILRGGRKERKEERKGKR
jgi:hypothetical protein